MEFQDIIRKNQEETKKNIVKGFIDCDDLFSEENIEKARSGIYSDNAENRRLNRVGQRYGSVKKEEPKKHKESANNNKGIEEHAKETSTENLKKVANNEKAPDDLSDDFTQLYNLWDSNFGSEDVDENGKEWEEVQRDYYKNNKEGKQTVKKLKNIIDEYGRRETYSQLKKKIKDDHSISNKELKILMSFV